MNRRSLLKTVMGGIGAVFIPKPQKENAKSRSEAYAEGESDGFLSLSGEAIKSDIENPSQHEALIGIWLQLKIKHNGTTCTGDCDWPTVTMSGRTDKEGNWITEVYVDGEKRKISKLDNGMILRYENF